VVLASGCRERTLGQLGVPGTRPAGIYTAGTAQYMVNVMNQLPGRRVAILGLGDIGLIMARRLTLEGAKVVMVLGQEATGLLRNQIRCVAEFGIPLRYGWGVASVHGHGRLHHLRIAPFAADGALDLGQAEDLRCDTLLVAAGLIPERDVLPPDLGDPSDGLILAGNADKPHDLVDQVSVAGLKAGQAAAQCLLGAQAKPLPQRFQKMIRKKIAEPKGRMSDYMDTLEFRPAPAVPQPVAGETPALPVAAKQGEAAAASGRLMVCTLCPTGCVMQVSENTSPFELTGNGCPRGLEFAAAELACPRRLFTGTVRVGGAACPLLPVRTSAEVPRDKLMDVARACRKLQAQAPVQAGDVLLADVAKTGCALVAAADCPSADQGVI